MVTKQNRSSYVQVTITIVKSQSAWDVQSHNWHVKVLDFAPFRGSYVREFELSHGNLVNRIIKITHAHNLHVKMLVFDPFTIRTLKKRKLFTTKFSQRFEEITLASLQHLQLNYVSCNVKVDSLTFINFVSERIIFLKLVYRINNTRCIFKKNKLPFKLVKAHFICRILSN